MITFFMAPVYVGVMSKSTDIEDFKVVGDSVEILCNPLVNPEKNVVGPVNYRIHPSFLEVMDSFPANTQCQGFIFPRNYGDVFRELVSRQGIDEPLIALFRKESIPVDCFLCSDYPRDEKVYVARVSPGLVDTLKSVGRDFMKEL